VQSQCFRQPLYRGAERRSRSLRYGRQIGSASECVVAIATVIHRQLAQSEPTASLIQAEARAEAGVNAIRLAALLGQPIEPPKQMVTRP
jgi:hypothetical protein